MRVLLLGATKESPIIREYKGNHSWMVSCMLLRQVILFLLFAGMPSFPGVGWQCWFYNRGIE
jgi:hypothetical protein